MRRRRGPVETFSVSVDASTKRILKAHAERLFDGNMSAMISAFAREAERRDALAWLLRDSGGSTLTDELRAEILGELRASPKKRRRKPAA